MTITTLDGLIDALGNSAQDMTFNKASIANMLSGGYASLWRATGTPGQGAIPGAAAICTDALTGAVAFTNPADPVKTYLARLSLAMSVVNASVELHDRLAHMGGLSGTTATAQTVNVDVTGTTSNIDNRRGASDYSDVQWWLEIYTDIGATGVTATVTYTRAPGGGGDTGRTTTLTIGGASPANRAGRLFPIIPQAGEWIQSVQSIQHATTTTAGSYGITATRRLTDLECVVANRLEVGDWARLGLPRIHDDACLMLAMLCGTTSTGTVIGHGKLAQG